MAGRHLSRVAHALLFGLLLWTAAAGRTVAHTASAPPDPAQGATSDRLAQPVLGEWPTQVEVGRYHYYYNCMPCHGDRGQGLTDEWRGVWVEDHQNCWARGCHTGKSELAAFYIPRSVPPVTELGHFETAEALFAFLRATQPPQRPGTLTDAEYWALTAYLLFQSGRLSPAEEVGPSTPATWTAPLQTTLGALAALALALWTGAHSGGNRSATTR